MCVKGYLLIFSCCVKEKDVVRIPIMVVGFLLEIYSRCVFTLCAFRRVCISSDTIRLTSGRVSTRYVVRVCVRDCLEFAASSDCVFMRVRRDLYCRNMVHCYRVRVVWTHDHCLLHLR